MAQKSHEWHDPLFPILFGKDPAGLSYYQPCAKIFFYLGTQLRISRTKILESLAKGCCGFLDEESCAKGEGVNGLEVALSLHSAALATEHTEASVISSYIISILHHGGRITA